MPDEAVFDHVHALMQERGSEGVTFAALAERSGLSGATLVQRFGTKQKLVHAALVHAWQRLEERTQRFAEEAERSPEGAVLLLQKLSGSYGDIDTYADNLQILREDLRDPELRARGSAWVETLVVALDGEREVVWTTALSADEALDTLATRAQTVALVASRSAER